VDRAVATERKLPQSSRKERSWDKQARRFERVRLTAAPYHRKQPAYATAVSRALSKRQLISRGAEASLFHELPREKWITMKDQYNVLFLCTGNSARSIMAEAILNFKGKPRFTAYSAGSHPSGQVRPDALQRLEAAKIPTGVLRSKNWDEFAKPDSPKMDFVFTVCDNAAKEVCPVWPGQPMTAHWGVPDPAAVQGSPLQVERAFREAFTILERRIGLFLSLPLAALDRMALKKEVDRIGRQ